MADKPDKIARLRDLLKEFDNSEDAVQVAVDAHLENVRKKRMDAAKPLGRVQVTNWDGLAAHYNTPDAERAPLQQLIPQLCAEIQACIVNRDDNDLFGLFVTLARAVKPQPMFPFPQQG